MRYQAFRWINKIPIWVIPLAITIFLFFPAKTVNLTSDGSYYASAGVYVANGYGILDIDQSYITGRPGLPILFGIAFKLFGPTHLTAFYTLRFFYLFMPLVVYGLGKKLYNSFTGLTASLFVLTSYNLNNWASDIQIDYILPFFILLSVYVFVVALVNQKTRYFVLSGILMAAALLIKESSIFFLPLPGLCFIFIKKYRNARMFKQLVFLYLAFGLVVIIWAVYIIGVTGNPLAILGQTAPDALNLLSSGGAKPVKTGIVTKILGLVLKFGSSLINYYNLHLKANFLLAPLLVASSFWVCFEAFVQKNNISSKIIALVYLCGLPMIYFQGSVGFRSQQSIILFLFLFVSLAYGIGLASNKIVQLIRTQMPPPIYISKILPYLITAMLICPVIVFEGNGGLFKYIKNYNLYDYLANPTKEINVEVYDKQILSNWLTENVEPGAHIMGYVHNIRPNAFLTQGKYVFYNYPFTNSTSSCNINPSSGKQQVLVLDIDQFGNQFMQELDKSNLIAITEGKFIEYVRQNRVEYFILSGQYRRLSAYLFMSPYFSKVADFNNGNTQIFKTIQEPEVIGVGNSVSKYVPQFMASLENSNSARYDALMNYYFKGCLKWDSSDVDTLIMNNKSTVSAFTERYSQKEYIAWCKKRSGIDECIQTTLKKVDALPQDPWLAVILGNLYYLKGDLDNAIEWHRKALLVSDDPSVKSEIEIGVNADDVETYIMRYPNFPNRSSAFTTKDNQDYVEVLNFIDLFNQSNSLSSDDTNKIYPTTFVINRKPKTVLFEHPDSSVRYRLQIPKNAILEISPALSQEVWMKDGIDGVNMSVELQSRNQANRLYEIYQNPRRYAFERSWITSRVDLFQWGGETIDLNFLTDSNGNNLYDWAGWGEPRILVPIVYDFLNQFSQASKIGNLVQYLQVSEMSINYEAREVLFAHPHSWISYNVALPEKPTLMFGIGMAPAVWDVSKGDGVNFNIYVMLPEAPDQLNLVYHRYLDPKNNQDDRQWVDERLDLSQYGGREVKVIFETDAGPNGNSDFDWAGWSRPVLVDGLGDLSTARLCNDHCDYEITHTPADLNP